MVLVAAGRTVRTAYRRTARRLSRHMGARAARATSVVLLVAVVVLVSTGVVWRVAVGAADRSFAARDALTPEDVTRPTSELRSGGPGSLVPWDSLGREGRVFTAGGPDAGEIEAATGTPAQQPIRAYAGAASADTARARADLAVRDLDRAGGFDRADLLVVTTTGTGWVEPSAAASFEYLTGGDSAMVAMQYSTSRRGCPSSSTRPRRARPDATCSTRSTNGGRRCRPTTGPGCSCSGRASVPSVAENAFSGEYDLANRTGGALFVGPPNFNPAYRQFVDERDAGSPEVEPVYRRRAHHPVRRTAPRDDPAGRRALAGQPGALPAAPVGPDRVVEPPAAAAPAGLARGAARAATCSTRRGGSRS